MHPLTRSLITVFVGIRILASAASIQGEELVRLQEHFPVGYQYHVSTRTDLAGSMSLPPAKDRASTQTLAVTGTSSIDYDERVLALETTGLARKTCRIYRRIDFQRKVGDRLQQSTIRPEVRRLVILRRQSVEVPFSPDGPLTWGEMDLVRTDVFTPALVGLLPEKPVGLGARWTAQDLAVRELTGMERVEDGKLECRLEQLTILQKRRHARVAFTGTVRGINEDGPNRQQLEGYFFFDLESNHLSYLFLKGIHSLLDKDGKSVGRIEGQFVLTRQAPVKCAELSDEALKGINLEDNPGNTLMLYENADLGIRFQHSRRWRVANVRGRQITLDETNGNGLLLTLEAPAQLPTGLQYLAEAREWLQRQKAKVLRVEPPKPLDGNLTGSEKFALDVEMGGGRIAMHYFVIRQKNGGATLAARVLPRDTAATLQEIDRLARSLEIKKAIDVMRK